MPCIVQYQCRFLGNIFLTINRLSITIVGCRAFNSTRKSDKLQTNGHLILASLPASWYSRQFGMIIHFLLSFFLIFGLFWTIFLFSLHFNPSMAPVNHHNHECLQLVRGRILWNPNLLVALSENVGSMQESILQESLDLMKFCKAVNCISTWFHSEHHSEKNSIFRFSLFLRFL